MRRVRASALLLAALAIARCVHVPPKPVVPEDTARVFEQRSLAAMNVARWDLDALTKAALQLQPDLDVARAEAAVAEAARIAAGERPNPTATLPIEHKAEPKPWIVTLDADFTIETAGKRAIRAQHANDVARAAALGVAQRAWEVRSAIRTQLAAMRAAGRAAAILRRQQEAQNDLIEALAKRVEVGEGSRVELTQARIASRQAQLLLRDREGDAGAARARLAAAVGVPAIDVSVVNTPPEWEEDSHARELALRARPDLLVSLAEYAAAESDLRLELAKQVPDFHLAPGFGWDQGAARWDLGLSSILPLFSRNRGGIAEAEARRTLAEKRFLALQAKVIAAIDEANARLDAAKKKSADADALVTEARRQLELVRKSFEAGESDRVALRSAELELASAELARADAAAQADQAWGALEDAVEQPLTKKETP